MVTTLLMVTATAGAGALPFTVCGAERPSLMVSGQRERSLEPRTGQRDNPGSPIPATVVFQEKCLCHFTSHKKFISMIFK